MTTSDKVSIIVPVYKVEAYLADCIESILAQSYPYFELILINDGSPDQCGTICDTYASKDKRIRVIHKTNGGVSSARNMGLNQAEGKYICFVDSDDVIAEDYILDLVSDYNKLGGEGLVIHNYRFTNSPNPKLNLPELIVKNNRRQIVDNFIHYHLISFSVPYAKLFSRDVIVKYKIEFPVDVHMGEDGIFDVLYLSKVDSLLLSDKCAYFITQREDSLVRRYNDFESEYLGYKLLKSAVEELIKSADIAIDEKEHEIWTSTQSLFIRTIQSVYRNNNSGSIARQVQKLRTISPVDISLFKRYYNEVKVRRKLNHFLVSNSLYYPYCLVGNVSQHLLK